MVSYRTRIECFMPLMRLSKCLIPWWTKFFGIEFPVMKILSSDVDQV